MSSKWWQPLLFLLLLLQTTKAAQPIKGPPIAEQHQLSRVARLGSEVRLSCPLSSFPEALVLWTKDSEPIMPHTHTRMRLSRKTLRIKHLQREDAGLYVCRGVNGFGSSENVNIDLVVIDPSDFPSLGADELPDVSLPTLTSSTSRAFDSFSSVMAEGDSFQILCEARGKPRPSIKWFKDDQPLSTVEGYLSVNNARIQDSGTYRCEASNLIGSVNRSVQVEVLLSAANLEQPRLPMGPINTTVKSGQMAVLECLVQSAATPSIRWLKRVEGWAEGADVIDVGDDKFVQIGKESFGVNNGHNEYIDRLVIDHAHEGDRGMYYCFVTNPSGYRFKNAYLDVLPHRESRLPLSSRLGQGPLLAAMCALLLVLLAALVLSVCLVRRSKKLASNTSMETPLPEAQENLMRANTNIYKMGSYTTMPHQIRHQRHQRRLDQTLPLPPEVGFGEKRGFYPHHRYPQPPQNQYEVPHLFGEEYKYSTHSYNY